MLGKRKRSEEDEFAEGSTMAAQHRSTEHHKYRSPLNCVDRYSHQWQVYSRNLVNIVLMINFPTNLRLITLVTVLFKSGGGYTDIVF